MPHRSLKSRLLVAPPHLSDPNFRRTVVLVCEHTPEGAFGLVLNRPAGLKVAKLWEVVGGGSVTTGAHAFVGGPVESHVVWLLHACEDLAAGADPVMPGVWLGNDREIFGALIEREAERESRGEGPELFRAYCGYAGWGEGQLESELQRGGWIVQPATSDLVFAPDVAGLWLRALERQGGIYRLFAKMPQDPELN